MSTTTSDPLGLAALAASLATPRRGEAAGAWLRDAIASVLHADQPGGRPLQLAMARSRRILGQDLLAPTAAELDAMHPALPGRLSGPSWRLLDVGRAALVLPVLEAVSTDRAATIFDRMLRRGELSEQESLLRMLPLLPHASALVEPAVEACRTNVPPVFAAIALFNPFPARWFPDLSFNQLVLKAMFMGLPIECVEGLPSRATAQLARMALGYGSEREAAGRSVPSGVQHIVQLAHNQAPRPATESR